MEFPSDPQDLLEISEANFRLVVLTKNKVGSAFEALTTVDPFSTDFEINCAASDARAIRLSPSLGSAGEFGDGVSRRVQELELSPLGHLTLLVLYCLLCMLVALLNPIKSLIAKTSTMHKNPMKILLGFLAKKWRENPSIRPFPSIFYWRCLSSIPLYSKFWKDATP